MASLTTQISTNAFENSERNENILFDDKEKKMEDESECQNSHETFDLENKESQNQILKASDIKDCDAFGDIPSDVEVSIQTGDTFDLKSVKIKKHPPSTNKYRIFTFKNPKSKRIIKILKCDEENCGKHFRKWHNFFDHLRIHTNERPY